LATVANDETARQRIRPLVLRLAIWIGLDFEAGKFEKREVRRLRRGVIAFGQDNLPVPLHGVRHVAADEAAPAPRAAASWGRSAGLSDRPRRRRAHEADWPRK